MAALASTEGGQCSPCPLKKFLLLIFYWTISVFSFSFLAKLIFIKDGISLLIWSLISHRTKSRTSPYVDTTQFHQFKAFIWMTQFNFWDFFFGFVFVFSLKHHVSVLWREVNSLTVFVLIYLGSIMRQYGRKKKKMLFSKKKVSNFYLLGEEQREHWRWMALWWSKILRWDCVVKKDEPLSCLCASFQAKPRFLRVRKRNCFH